jgi:hypothetical protein
LSGNRPGRGPALAAAAAALVGLPAAALEPPLPDLAGHFPLYPGLYASTNLSWTRGSRSFDKDGDRKDAFPATSGRSDSAEALRGELSFAWTFPLFQDEGIPFLSTRLHTFRVIFRGSPRLGLSGAFADFAADRGVSEPEDGLGDLSFEAGSWLVGTGHWRDGEPDRFALLALLALDLPVGAYDPDAPVHSGTNVFAFRPTLGAFARLGPRTFLDGAVAYEIPGRNDEAAFGRLDPTEPGARLFFDGAISWRIFPSIYLSGFLRYWKSRPNAYEDPQFAPDAPPPSPGFESRPVPGRYRDDGAWLLLLGPGIDWFATQRMRLGFHAYFPVAGAGGQFVLPFEQRPQDCAELAPDEPGCAPVPAGQATVDGLGPARAVASPVLWFGMTYGFPQGGSWP